MEKHREQLFCLALVCALALGATTASALNPFGVVHSFTNAPSDGANPEGQPILIGSNLFGVAFNGGAFDLGGIFQCSTNGANYNFIYSFDGDLDGANPFCTLAASGPFFYGMTFNGGVNDGGVVFRVRTNGTSYAVLHTFMGGGTDGIFPFGSVIVTNGTLFGMTFNGGTNDSGVAFKMNTNTTGFVVLHSFQGGTIDGASPSEGVTLSGTNLFGTTSFGGSNDVGTVFSMGTNGANYKILHHFSGTNSDGAFPSGPLTVNGSTLYGITTDGGTGNAGTIFKLNTDGSGYVVLYSFSTNNVTDGAYPQFGPLYVTNSLVYGVTENGGATNAGVVFQITTNGTGFTILHSFLGTTTDGAFPDWPPIFNSTNFFGLAIDGGLSNVGVVYASNALPASPPPCTNLTVLGSASSGVAFGTVVAGQPYSYTASGCVGFNLDGATSDPDGNLSQSSCAIPTGGPVVAGNIYLCPGLHIFSLVGKVGGACVQLGSSGVFVAPNSGTLTLYVNDNDFSDNSGSFTACITPVTQTCVTVPGATTGTVIGNVIAGQTYRYEASGCVSWGAFNQYSPPDGSWYSNNCTTFVKSPVPAAGYSPPFPCPDCNWTSLIGTINGGTCIQLGNSGTFVAYDSGPLSLSCNDNDRSDNGGFWEVCITGATNNTFQISAIAITNTNDIILTWNTTGGTTNAVQVTPGDAKGNFNTNGFVDLSSSIFITGILPTVTNYIDVGGATNYPCRYYRVHLVP